MSVSSFNTTKDNSVIIQLNSVQILFSFKSVSTFKSIILLNINCLLNWASQKRQLQGNSDLLYFILCILLYLSSEKLVSYDLYCTFNYINFINYLAPYFNIFFTVIVTFTVYFLFLS